MPKIAHFRLAAMLACLPVGAYAQFTSAVAHPASVAASDSEPIGLRVRFNRADPTYVIGEQLGLIVTAAKEASIEIWEMGADGALSKIAPRKGVLRVNPRSPLVLPMAGMNFRVGAPEGTTELHIIARTYTGSTRGIGSADARLPNRGRRQEVRLTYRVVR